MAERTILYRTLRNESNCLLSGRTYEGAQDVT